jgi:hypothetical protein
MLQFQIKWTVWVRNICASGAMATNKSAGQMMVNRPPFIPSRKVANRISIFFLKIVDFCDIG